jgi:pilus assembly protein CpaF
MVAMSGVQLPIRALRAQISSAISAVVHIERQEDGKRRLITMTEIFSFQRRGMSAHGEVLGELRATGIVPAFYKRIKQRGIALPIDRFTPIADKEDSE